ncbi:hypothetical protein HG1285_13327 [Hydrogenivirga sp. 128-5-R1-1]|nr:hypothetical protein HG1285_13327 [Hydrogenivirga sp. 128-5-R1-1]
MNFLLSQEIDKVKLKGVVRLFMPTEWVKGVTRREWL